MNGEYCVYIHTEGEEYLIKAIRYKLYLDFDSNV